MASNTIKGLTVEIGGDTTKLGKALKDVETKSRSLSKELGDINKLLKMDPGNADLLAQKQKVLAEAVENTADKLETLKAAEKQVQEQFKRGEVSEEQVRALQREIVVTTNKMEGYEKAVKETAEQIKKLGKETEDTADDTEKTKKGADKASDSLDDMAKSADKAGDASDGLGSKLGGLVKGGLAALAAGVTAAIGAMVGSAEATREYRQEMGKLDTAFTTNGHSSEAATKTYKTLQGVLGETDQAVEAANHLAKLTDNEEELAKWTDIATGVYATFGASLPIEGLTEAANETAKTGTLTGGLADALNWAGVNEEAFQEQLDACTTEQERQSLIMETLNGLYSEAADKYRETNAEIIRANEANEAWTASMAEVGGAVEPILTDVKLLGASLLSDLVPGVQEVATAFRGVLSGEDGAAQDFGAALSGIFDQLFDKITEVAPAVIETAVSLIANLTTAVVEKLPALTATLMEAVVSAINSLTAVAPDMWGVMIDGFMDTFYNLIAYVPDVIAALGDFLTAVAQYLPTMAEKLSSWAVELVNITAYAFEESIPVLLESAITLFTSILQAIPMVVTEMADLLPWIVEEAAAILTDNLPVLLDGAVQLFNAIVDAIPLIIEALVPQVSGIVEIIVQTLAENIPVLVEGAVALLDAIIQAIPLIIQALVPQVPTIVNAIIDGLIDCIPLLLDAALDLLTAIVDAIPEIVVMLLREVPTILDAITDVLSRLPALIWTILLQVISKVASWVVDMTSKGREAGTKMLNAVIDLIKQLPGKLWDHLTKSMTNLVNFGTQAASKARTAAKGIFDAVVNGIKSLPDNIKSIGSDIVRGLWNGINDMVGWVTGKIESFGRNVLDGIKDFFGIESPSKVFRDEVGKMLTAGLADGIEKNASDPLNAMADLSEEVLGEADALNGLTLERKLQHTFAAPDAVTAAESGMLSKLDAILSAIERGQVLTINGDALVGATIGKTDSALGRRRELVARGAI